MENLVTKLEAEGIIPKGKYIAVFRDCDIPNTFTLKAKDKKIGLYNSNSNIMISPKYFKIEKDEEGNYLCYGVTNGGLVFCERYDDKLNPSDFKDSN